MIMALVSKSRSRIIRLLVLWLILVVLAHGVAAFSSTLRPEAPCELRIRAWPPSGPLGPWFERAWFAPFERWDTRYFMKIADSGYAADDGTAQFHPLFPVTAYLLTPLKLPVLVSLSLVAFLSGIAFLVVLYLWARLDAEPDLAWAGVFLFMTSPFAFVLHLPYSEPLFLLMTGLCFVFLRKQQWVWAGLAGALATLTRQQGLLLVVPLGIALGRHFNWKLREIVGCWPAWVALALIPLPYTVWIAYRALALRDLTPEFTNPVRFIYSVLISPSAVKVVPQQTFIWPWQAFAFALRKTIKAPDIDMIINFGTSALFLLFTGIAWRRMKLESKVFTVMVILLSFSYSTGPEHPYMGLPRHLLLAVPVFAALGRSVTSMGWQLILIVSGVIGQMFLVMAFVLDIWVP